MSGELALAWRYWTVVSVVVVASLVNDVMTKYRIQAQAERSVEQVRVHAHQCLGIFLVSFDALPLL